MLAGRSWVLSSHAAHETSFHISKQVAYDEDRNSYQWRADERIHSRTSLYNYLRRNPEGTSSAAIKES